MEINCKNYNYIIVDKCFTCSNEMYTDVCLRLVFSLLSNPGGSFLVVDWSHLQHSISASFELTLLFLYLSDASSVCLWGYYVFRMFRISKWDGFMFINPCWLLPITKVWKWIPGLFVPSSLWAQGESDWPVLSQILLLTLLEEKKWHLLSSSPQGLSLPPQSF